MVPRLVLKAVIEHHALALAPVHCARARRRRRRGHVGVKRSRRRRGHVGVKRSQTAASAPLRRAKAPAVLRGGREQRGRATHGDRPRRAAPSRRRLQSAGGCAASCWSARGAAAARGELTWLSARQPQQPSPRGSERRRRRKRIHAGQSEAAGAAAAVAAVAFAAAGAPRKQGRAQRTTSRQSRNPVHAPAGCVCPA
eukprot:461340-Prymnesium_polylepis.1